MYSACLLVTSPVFKTPCHSHARLAFHGMQNAQVFHDLDVSKAQTRFDEDRDRILEQIESTRGMQQMTHDLKDALVKVRVGLGRVVPAIAAALIPSLHLACGCHMESARDEKRLDAAALEARPRSPPRTRTYVAHLPSPRTERDGRGAA